MSQGKKETVLVTGCTGYIALHCVQQLLKEGKYNVRGSVRSLKNLERNASVLALGNVELVEADLLNTEEWVKATKGCDYVLHTASPFVLTPKTEDELVKPAVQGTLAVLEACAKKDSSVKRVVLTSSVQSILYGDLSKVYNGHTFTEKDWTVVENVENYTKSKTLAEKAAWDFLKENKGKGDNSNQFDLNVINVSII